MSEIIEVLCTHKFNRMTMKHIYQENICQLRMDIQGANLLESQGQNAKKAKSVENIRNCDIFLDEHNVLFYADVRLFKFHHTRQFDLKDLNNIIVKYHVCERYYQFDLPCLPQNENEPPPEGSQVNELKNSHEEPEICYWKLKRITDSCRLQTIEGEIESEIMKFVANYRYGFGDKFQGPLRNTDTVDFDMVCGDSQPHLNSPLHRSVKRQSEEMIAFSAEQYKLNFVEMQVPEGHDDPMKVRLKFDFSITKEEALQMHNILCRAASPTGPYLNKETEIDCGLISILLSICHDLRSNGNETNCESAWSRIKLSATLCSFEPFDNMKNVLISFFRRSLIYPYYRNYDLSYLCVIDVIDALLKGRTWILHQLLITRNLFSEAHLQVFNECYINDYIRYVHNTMTFKDGYCTMLARNLKNVLPDVYKRHLQLNLASIEGELLNDLIGDMHIDTQVHGSNANSTTIHNEAASIAASDSSQQDGVAIVSEDNQAIKTEEYEDDDENEDDEDDDDEVDMEDLPDYSSSNSDTEENSVIEQRQSVENQTSREE